MFAKPRPKMSILPPPPKKRKTTSSVPEITFDDGARQEYLTGFHKRKLERVKHAQDQAAKQARQEKLDARKQLRDQRRREVEDHVQTVNRMLRESGAVVDPEGAEPSDDEGDGEWGGFPDKPDLDIIDHEEEYVDEDRYTTVTVEAISVSREGLSKPETGADETDEADDIEAAQCCDEDRAARKREARPAKIKKKKFRYESKIERQLISSRQRAKSTRRKQMSS